MSSVFHNAEVKGFLHADGKRIVNGAGEEILLTGWGLGNWLLCEGYMWLAGGKRMDRPRTIEKIVEEVAGREYAAEFWQKYRDNYVTEDDIRRMAELGYNSVRIPLNARLFLEEGPGLKWVDEGFDRLARLVDWCEKYNIYAFIDLHGAPGGQTGANIDDSIDNLPRLFIDEDCYQKGIALWVRLAEIYRDREIVGGYDLLNEPLRKSHSPEEEDMGIYRDVLRQWYKDCIAAVRKVDTRHMFTIEGHYFATNTYIFDDRFDDNMCIHFHRYACDPDCSCYEEWLELSERLQQPLWLGETGENEPEWFTAMYPLAAELGIGYNIWPWKKLVGSGEPNTVNRIPTPEGWEKLTDYAKGGKHPGYETAQKILDCFLENMKLENCSFNPRVYNSIFRLPGAVIHGTDFDTFPGKDVSYHSARVQDKPGAYRKDTGMEIVEKYDLIPRGSGFGYRWRKYVLGLEAGEFACYTLNQTRDGSAVAFFGYAEEGTELSLSADGVQLARVTVSEQKTKNLLLRASLPEAEKVVMKLAVISGRAEIEDVKTE